MKIFVDTNVLLDVLGRREPFYADSARIWTLAESGRVQAHVSALSLPNLFYVLRRARGAKPARKATGMLRDIFTLVPLDAHIAGQALDADIPDFEDAIQFFSSLRCEAAALVTRNPRDFPQGHVAVQTPSELLASRFAE